MLDLLPPTAGDVLYDGRNVGALPASERRALRRELGIVFQDPFASLNPRMSVADIVGEPIWLQGTLSRADRRAEASALLRKVGLRPEHGDRYPHEFSGGQRQRIGIARALGSSPKLLLGDEPVSALDVSVQAQVVNLLEDLKAEFGLTLLVVAHGLGVIRHMSDRVAVMYLGQIVELAPVDALFDDPLHPYAQALLASVPNPSLRARKARVPLEGDIPSATRPPPGCRFHTRCPHARPVCRELRPALEGGARRARRRVPFLARARRRRRGRARRPLVARLRAPPRAVRGAIQGVHARRTRLNPDLPPRGRRHDEADRPSLAALLLLAVQPFAALGAAAAPGLKIGLQEDPDFLDPARARSYVSRIVFASLCDKLIDTTPDLTFVPQLALSWTWSADDKTLTLKLRPGVTFQDGEAFDAEAVKFNLDRYRTLAESVRKSEVASIDHVDVVDPLTVNLILKQPDAALVAQLTDRSGMMMAPKATAAGSATANPVCSGPYRFVERVAQDRIVLDRFPGYWNAGAYHLDRVTFMPIPDTTVRLANLQSGGLDLIERMAATDVKTAQADPKLQVLSIPGLGFMTIEFNVTGDDAKTPMGRDKRVRQAFDLAIDRDALNQAVYEGRFTLGDQPFAPASPYHLDQPVPGRDVDKPRRCSRRPA